MDDFKTLIGKVATGATLTRGGSRERVRPHDVGRGDASQMGGLLMGLRLRGETVDEITGAVTDDARQDDQGRGAPRRDRRGRHRRRRVGLLQYFHLRGLYRGGRRHSGRQARQPRAVVALRAADVLGALGVKIDLRPDEITRCIYEAGIGFMFAPRIILR